jgi:signal transduction histidine kinase
LHDAKIGLDERCDSASLDMTDFGRRQIVSTFGRPDFTDWLLQPNEQRSPTCCSSSDPEQSMILSSTEIDELLKRSHELLDVEHSESLALARRACEASSAIHYDYGYARALQLIGINEAKIGADIVDAPFRNSIPIFQSLEAWKELAISMSFLANGLGRKGQFFEAQSMLEAALAIAEEHNEPLAQRTVLNHLGYLFYRRKQITKSLDAFQRSLAISKALGESGLLAHNGLGAVYRETKQFEESVSCYNRALEVEKNASKHSRILLYANRGLVYEDAGKPRQALDDLLRARVLAEENGDIRNGFQIQSAIPRVHLRLDEVDEARLALDKLFGMLSDTMEDIFQCSAYNVRADYHVYRSEWKAAIDDLDAALVFADRSKNILQLKSIHDELSTCYKELGQFAEALEHREMYTKIVLESMTDQLAAKVKALEADHKQTEIQQQNEIFQLKNIELTEANLSLNDANVQKDRFLSILRHDLRHPISSIIGYSNLLATGEEGMSKTDVASVIEESSRRLLGIMDDLIASAKSGTPVLDRKPTNVGELLSEIAKIVRPLAQAKEIKVEVTDETSGAECSIDVNKMYQALTNLMFNAIKFTGAQGTILLVACISDEGWLTIRLQDTGIGMSANILQRVLEGSPETQRRGTHGEQGTGLGISIATSVIELHQGHLSISSIEGKGTEITISIPAMLPC